MGALTATAIVSFSRIGVAAARTGGSNLKANEGYLGARGRRRARYRFRRALTSSRQSGVTSEISPWNAAVKSLAWGGEASQHSAAAGSMAAAASGCRFRGSCQRSSSELTTKRGRATSVVLPEEVEERLCEGVASIRNEDVPASKGTLPAAGSETTLSISHGRASDTQVQVSPHLGQVIAECPEKRQARAGGQLQDTNQNPTACALLRKPAPC